MVVVQVVVVLIDVCENLVDQDFILIGVVMDEGWVLVIVVNKWDGMDVYQCEQCQCVLECWLVFVDWVKMVFILVLYGLGLCELMCVVVCVYSVVMCELGLFELIKVLEKVYESYQLLLV